MATKPLDATRGAGPQPDLHPGGHQRHPHEGRARPLPDARLLDVQEDPHWDELIFLPGTLTRFVIEGYREKCETKTVLGSRFAKKPIELDIPVYITGMSFGALSLEAKMALAKGASMAGTATCSGEGGMIPPERDLSTKWYYQVIQSRVRLQPHHLMLADAIEFFIGQGCKVGLGDHLMGQKGDRQVAEMRSGCRPGSTSDRPGGTPTGSVPTTSRSRCRRPVRRTQLRGPRSS